MGNPAHSLAERAVSALHGSDGTWMRVGDARQPELLLRSRAGRQLGVKSAWKRSSPLPWSRTCAGSSSTAASPARGPVSAPRGGGSGRLCRYITRPPVSHERLERLADGRLELRLKHAWKDGTRALVLEPDDLMVRLVAAVPPPYFHLLRYFGVLSSHSGLRKEVVPHPPPDTSATAPPPAPGDQLELALDAESDEPTGASVGPGCSGTCSRPTWILAPAARVRCAGCRPRPPPTMHAICSRGSGSLLALRQLRPRLRSASSSCRSFGESLSTDRGGRVHCVRLPAGSGSGSSTMRQLFPTRTSLRWAPPPLTTGSAAQRARRFPSSISLGATQLSRWRIDGFVRQLRAWVEPDPLAEAKALTYY